MTSSHRWGSFHLATSDPAESPLQEWKPQCQPCCCAGSATGYLLHYRDVICCGKVNKIHGHDKMDQKEQPAPVILVHAVHGERVLQAARLVAQLG